jgi:hypothetical protein
MGVMDNSLSKAVFNGLVEEIEAIIVEKVYDFQMAKLDLYWLTGETLRKYEADHKIPITKLVEMCAADNRIKGRHMSDRSLWDAVKIYDTYPTKEFPGEKGATLTKVRKLLAGDQPKIEEPIDTQKIAGDLIQKYGFDTAKQIAEKIIHYNDGAV